MLRFAPEVAEIANDVIAKVERHHRLALCRIEYVFIDKAPRSKGRLVLGRARRMGGLAAFIAGRTTPEAFTDPVPLFVIEISHNTWERLTDPQRRALVDHELCHCLCELDDDGEPVLSTKGHDFEEFREIIERHGMWNSGTTELGSIIAEQLAFAIDSVTTFVEGLGHVDTDTGEIAGDEQ
jgi:hypothetical protein